MDGSGSSNTQLTQEGGGGGGGWRAAQNILGSVSDRKGNPAG